MEFNKQFLTAFIVMFLFSFPIFSQEDDGSIKALALTEEQKSLLKEQLELTKQIREQIKSNLSAEQKKMLANKSLTRKQRLTLLRKSLSDRQRTNLNRNQNLLRDKRISFRKTVTKRQMIRFRQFVRDKNRKDRRRLVRRLHDLIRDNITDRR